MGLRQRLRLVEHDQQQIARAIGRDHRGERGEHLGLGVAAAHHLLGGAGLAADIVARHVGAGGGALLGVEAHQVAHLVAGLGLDHLLRHGHRLLGRAPQEGGRHEVSAIDQRTDRRDRLQRRDRKPVPERDGRGVELAPVPGDQRLGALRQFRAQPIELAQLLEEPLVVFDAQARRHARAADVGRVGEDLGQRQHAVLGVEIVDGELAELQRMAGIDRRPERELAGVERHGERQRLERRAHLVDAGGEPVDAGGIERLTRIVGIVVRLRHHGDDLAGAHVGDDAGGGDRLELLTRRDQLVAQRVLDAQVDGELDRLLQPVGGKARQMEIGEPAAVEPFLNAGNALVVDIDVPDDVRDLGAVGIDAFVLGQKADAGNAEPVDLLTLLRRDLALEPDEAPLGRQALAQFAGVHVRHDRGQKLRRLVDIDDALRLRKQRRRAHVGRQHLAVAVEDVGPRGRDRVLHDRPPHPVTVGRRREHYELRRDHSVAEREDEDRKPDTRARLGGAVDVLAVEQRAHHAPTPRLVGRRGRCLPCGLARILASLLAGARALRLRRRRRGRRLGRGHRQLHIGCVHRARLVHRAHLLGAGTLPVAERSTSSGLAITVPIGSGSPAGTSSGGRAGRLSSRST